MPVLRERKKEFNKRFVKFLISGTRVLSNRPTESLMIPIGPLVLKKFLHKRIMIHCYWVIVLPKRKKGVLVSVAFLLRLSISLKPV